MSLTELLQDEVVNQSISRVFKDFSGTPNEVILFWSICILIGIASLTWRYVILYKNEDESRRWKEEIWLTKIILSVMVGFLSYVFVLGLDELIRAVTFFMGSKTNIPLFPLFDIKGIVVSTVYSTTLLFHLRNKIYRHYEDIKIFVIINVIAPFYIVFLSIFFLALRINYTVSILAGLFLFILTIGLIGYFNRKNILQTEKIEISPKVKALHPASNKFKRNKQLSSQK